MFVIIYKYLKWEVRFGELLLLLLLIDNQLCPKRDLKIDGGGGGGGALGYVHPRRWEWERGSEVGARLEVERRMDDDN